VSWNQSSFKNATMTAAEIALKSPLTLFQKGEFTSWLL
jgi:hypothetical protein